MKTLTPLAAAMMASSCLLCLHAFTVSVALHLSNLALPSSPEEVAWDVYEMVRKADVPWDMESVMAGSMAELVAFDVLPAIKQSVSARVDGTPSYLSSKYRIGNRKATSHKYYAIVEVFTMQMAKLAIAAAGVPRSVLLGVLFAIASVGASLGAVERHKIELLAPRFFGPDASFGDVPREVLSGVLYVLLKEVLRVELDGSTEHLVDLAHLLLGGAATLGANLLTGRPATEGLASGGLFCALYERFLGLERVALPNFFKQELFFDRILDLVDTKLLSRE